LEEHLLKKKFIEEMTTYELGEIAKGYGYDRGSDDLWLALENQMLKQ